MIDLSAEDKECVQSLNRMDAEVNAGKVLVPALRDYPSCLYRDDQGKYVLSTQSMYFRRDSIRSLFDEIREIARTNQVNLSHAHVVAARSMITIYASWQVLNTSLLAPFVKGQTLLSLRHELEAGETVSPIPVVGNPYCVEKTFSDPNPFCDARVPYSGFIVYSPDPRIGVLANYDTVDELFACNLHTHFPIWIVGKSPEYKAMEESFLAEQARREVEQAAIDNAPHRMMEVSEREYLEILDWRNHALEMHDSVMDDELLPDDPF